MRLTTALLAQLDTRPRKPEGPTPWSGPPLPADLGAIAASLSALQVPAIIGQWELGIGGADVARHLLAELEPIEGERPELQHAFIVANNAGGLLVLVGWNDGDQQCQVFRADEEYGELDPRGTFEQWLGDVVDNPKEAELDRQGLVAHLRSATG